MLRGQQNKPTVNKTNNMATPIAPKTKFHFKAPGDTIDFVSYTTNMAKQTKLPEGVIKGIAMAVKSKEEYDYSSIEGKTKVTAAKEFAKTFKTQLAAHEKNKAAFESAEAAKKAEAKETREAEKAAAEAAKAKSAGLLKTSLFSKGNVALASQLTKAVDDGISKSLGSAFKVSTKTGLIILANKDQKPTPEEFAVAFASLVNNNETSDTIKDRSAKAEAQVAYLAEQTLGESWSDLYSERPKDLARVRTGIKVFKTIKAIGGDATEVFANLPLSTTRALTEMRVTDMDKEGSQDAADKKNLAAKAEVLALAKAKMQEQGGNLTQTEAKNIVSEYKAKLGIKAKLRMKYFFLLNINGEVHSCGTTEMDDKLLAVADVCIDYNGNIITVSKNGNVVTPLVAPSEEILAHVRDTIGTQEEEAPKKGKDKDKKADKKAPKKKAPVNDEEEDDGPEPADEVEEEEEAATEEEEVEEETEDEDESDDSDDDDGDDD